MLLQYTNLHNVLNRECNIFIICQFLLRSVLRMFDKQIADEIVRLIIAITTLWLLFYMEIQGKTGVWAQLKVEL